MRASIVSLTAAAMLAASVLPAQVAGTYVSYGAGCKGTGSSGLGCINMNYTSPFSGLAAASANFAVLTNTGTSVRVICGFELFCATRTTGTVNVNVWIYDRSTTGLPGKILATSSMRVTSTPAWNRATFTSPLIIKANTDFFLVLDNRAGLRMPIASTGTKNIHYWSGPPAWRGPFTSVPWKYNVLCCGGGGAVPVLSNTGVPVINKSFDINLSLARASSAAVLLFGALRVNVNLSSAGAPGCFLLTPPILIVGLPTSATGTAKLTIPIPNDTRLIRARFQQQWAVIDPPTNALQLVFSNGGEGQIGG